MRNAFSFFLKDDKNLIVVPDDRALKYRAMIDFFAVKNVVILLYKHQGINN